MMTPSESALLATGACPECLGTMEVWFLKGIDVPYPQGTKNLGLEECGSQKLNQEPA